MQKWHPIGRRRIRACKNSTGKETVLLSEININKHLDVRAFVAYAKENGVSTLDLAKEGRKMFLMAREKKTCTLDEFSEE